jgi:hypothetical protein
VKAVKEDNPKFTKDYLNKMMTNATKQEDKE